jgi:hypothetical protein
MAAVNPWVWGNIGFNMVKNRWFVDLRNHQGTVQVYSTASLLLRGGCGIQYQWPTQDSRSAWHVRERIFANDIETFHYEKDGLLVGQGRSSEAYNAYVPNDYFYLCYAFSNATSRGFVEFYDERDTLIAQLKNKWLILEDVARRTVGQFPKIRFRIERCDVAEILLSRTAMIIIGKEY